MKPIFQSLIALIIILAASSCKKDKNPTHITDFETKIFNAVNTYRESKLLPKITMQYLMVEDAQIYSKKMADGVASYGVDGIMVILNEIKTNLGGDASGAVVQFSEFENADTVVNRMIRDPVKRQVLEQNFNQTGVGAAKDNSGNWYVTQLFIHIP
jgi:uncharacterized protein YkwD